MGFAERFKRGLMSWGIIIGAAILIYGGFAAYEAIVYNTVTHDKYHVFTNYTEETYTASVNGETYEVGPLDDVVAASNYEGDVNISVTNADGETVKELTHTFDKKPGGIILALVDMDDERKGNFCIYERPMGEYFYESAIPTSGGSRRSLTKIGEQLMEDTYLIPEGSVGELVVLPGEYSGAKLPDEIDRSDVNNVKGVFMASCDEGEANTTVNLIL